ncbi:hypothetical protein BCV72DRAFT_324977, partial [Rhizopus microsporus var. microsporus]
RRLYNRDTAATLNFALILKSLRETGASPARFKRPEKRSRLDDSTSSVNKKQRQI